MIVEGAFSIIITLITFWDLINLPSAFLWGLLLGIFLSLMANLKVIPVAICAALEDIRITTYEEQRKKAQAQFRKRPVTSRALSKLISLGRNDITLADLVMLDEMQSNGGLNPMTVQILDGIRKVVLEDVEGKVGDKGNFIEG